MNPRTELRCHCQGPCRASASRPSTSASRRRKNQRLGRGHTNLQLPHTASCTPPLRVYERGRRPGRIALHTFQPRPEPDAPDIVPSLSNPWEGSSERRREGSESMNLSRQRTRALHWLAAIMSITVAGPPRPRRGAASQSPPNPGVRPTTASATTPPAVCRTRHRAGAGRRLRTVHRHLLRLDPRD